MNADTTDVPIRIYKMPTLPIGLARGETMSSLQSTVSQREGQGEVGTEVDRLSIAIKQLDSSVEKLFQKLGGVLKTPAGKGEEPAESPKKPLVPLADRIRDETDRLQSTISQLSILHGQIEL